MSESHGNMMLQLYLYGRQTVAYRASEWCGGPKYPVISVFVVQWNSLELTETLIWLLHFYMIYSWIHGGKELVRKFL